MRQWTLVIQTREISLAKNKEGWLTANFWEIAFTVFLVPALGYIGFATHDNAQQLTKQAEELKSMHGEVKDIKKSFIAFLLDANPNKSEIIRGLVNDAKTLEGIDRFRAGRLEDAYAVWTKSARQGSVESAYAIAAANAALKQQIEDPTLDPSEREKAEAALRLAPHYYLDASKSATKDDMSRTPR